MLWLLNHRYLLGDSMKCPICSTEMIDDEDITIPDFHGNPLECVTLKCPKGCDLTHLSKWTFRNKESCLEENKGVLTLSK